MPNVSTSTEAAATEIVSTTMPTCHVERQLDRTWQLMMSQRRVKYDTRTAVEQESVVLLRVLATVWLYWLDISTPA